MLLPLYKYQLKKKKSFCYCKSINFHISEISPESNSEQILQKSFRWDYKLRSPAYIHMKNNPTCMLKILWSMSEFGGLWKHLNNPAYVKSVRATEMLDAIQQKKSGSTYLARIWKQTGTSLQPLGIFFLVCMISSRMVARCHAGLSNDDRSSSSCLGTQENHCAFKTDITKCTCMNKTQV